MHFSNVFIVDGNLKKLSSIDDLNGFISRYFPIKKTLHFNTINKNILFSDEHLNYRKYTLKYNVELFSQARLNYLTLDFVCLVIIYSVQILLLK